MRLSLRMRVFKVCINGSRPSARLGRGKTGPPARPRPFGDNVRPLTRRAFPMNTGILSAALAFLCWGMFPLYFHAIDEVPPLQILAHRMLWSLLFLVIVLAVRRQWTWLSTVRQPRVFGSFVASALLLSINWLIYIWAVNNGHVIEASLGYFINPLVNVLFGVLLLGEGLRRLQLVAVLIASLGVIALTLAGGGALWISLTLAVTFALYGLVRKVAAIDALGGLTVETVLLGPPAAILLATASYQGNAAFGHDLRTDMLLAVSGIATALPLLLFAAAARRLPLVTLGLLQYVAPTLQFLIGVLAFGERMPPLDRIAFPLIWAGCLVYAYDGVRTARAVAPVVR